MKLRSRSFRRSLAFTQDVFYALDEDQVHCEIPSAKSDMDWSIFPKVKESPYGFALFQKGERIFYWLPKDGFDSPESIARCRELLRRKIPKTKLQPA